MFNFVLINNVLLNLYRVETQQEKERKEDGLPWLVLEWRRRSEVDWGASSWRCGRATLLTQGGWSTCVRLPPLCGGLMAAATDCGTPSLPVPCQAACLVLVTSSHTHTHTHTQTHAHTHARRHAHAGHTHAHTHTRTHTHTHTYAHTHTRTHARGTHARTHARTHTRTHARTHARTHTHTHTHTFSLFL